MPSKPLHPCAQSGCRELTRERFCPAHKREETRRYERFERDPNHDKYYDARWKKIRAAFLRAHPLCERCRDEGRLTAATLVHHKIRVRAGGSHDPENLQALCPACHEAIHAAAGERF